MKFGAKYFEAAALIDDAYEGRLITPHMLDKDGVQAYLTADNECVIPGTNERADWFDFNFKVRGKGSNHEWHEGFLLHASTVYHWLREIDHQVDAIYGHSLGAASAQIVGFSLGVPTLAFAAPRVLVPDANVDAPSVICINRKDDTVTYLPPYFQHIGEVKVMKPSWHFGEDHRIRHYGRAMSEANKKNRRNR